MDELVNILPLFIGWILDMIFGDPVRLPHPIVWFGKIISGCERRLNSGKEKELKGGICAIALIGGIFISTYWFIRMLSLWIWVKVAVESILVFYCLSGKTLIEEVRCVFHAVEMSLEAGRRQVGRIVGRDTSELSAQEIRTAALETLAENLSDGVVAPLFWYALLGVPGMLAYKMVNTLDSMIGYRTERYRQFGLVAARIDDIANFIPARITALLMVIVSGKGNLIGFVRKYGSQHASPNSGYPEAALAGIIDCRFGGPHNYFGEYVYKPFIGINHRDFTYTDVMKAIKVNRLVEICMVFIAAGIRCLILL